MARRRLPDRPTLRVGDDVTALKARLSGVLAGAPPTVADFATLEELLAVDSYAHLIVTLCLMPDASARAYDHWTRRRASPLNTALAVHVWPERLQTQSKGT